MNSATRPRSLGKYSPIAELGRGGMATVYLASANGPAGFTKLVVVKELRDDLSGDPEFCSMFLDEARLAARLNHPHIVQTYEIVDVDSRFMIVMEYLEGQSLSSVNHRMRRDGKFDLAHGVRVLIDLLDGLNAAHELRDYDGSPLQVVHRDVSPHNVFITYAGDVKVVDFGIAKAATAANSTRAGVVKGKIRYMAPEQAFGRPVDRRADVFAVGVMLWEMLTKQRMWQDLPDAAIMHRLASSDIPRPVDVASDLDPLLVAICERAIAVSLDERYATASDMRADLVQFLDERGLRPDTRAFGQQVAEMFDDERVRIRAVIEEQMRLTSAMSMTSAALKELPKLNPGAPDAAHSSSPSHSFSAPAIVDPTTYTDTVLAAGEAPRRPIQAPKPSTSRLAIGAGLVAVGAVVAFVTVNRSAPTAPAASQVPASQPPTTEAPKAPSIAAEPHPAAMVTVSIPSASTIALTSPAPKAPALPAGKPGRAVEAKPAVQPEAKPTAAVEPPPKPAAPAPPSPLDIRMTR